MFDGILQLGETIKKTSDNLNYLFICLYIENTHYNNELILMGSNDKINYFDYLKISPYEDITEVYKIRDIFKYYKLVNIGPVLKCKISIFSK